MTNEVSTSFELYTCIRRTATEYDNYSDTTYDAGRFTHGENYLMNAQSYARAGQITYFDGTDRHMRFEVLTNGSKVGNDILHLDSIELIPPKLVMEDASKTYVWSLLHMLRMDIPILHGSMSIVGV